MIAKVALSAATYAIDKPYDYLIPTELETTLVAGMRVIVPFGAGNRRTEGIVLALGEHPPEGVRMKKILTQLDDNPVLDGGSIKLALWMRERYFCTVYDAARAMLPAGIYFSLQDSWHIADGVEKEAAYELAGKSHNAKHLLDLVYGLGGKADVVQIRSAFEMKNPNPALKLLADGGVLRLETNAQRGVQDKTAQIAQLQLQPEEAMSLMEGKRRSAPIQVAVVELLCATGAVSAKELCYFTGASMPTLRALVKKGILSLEKQEVLRRVEVEEPVVLAGDVVLNPQQQSAFEGLCRIIVAQKPAAALLYGVTGSGKTQVYIKLIREVLALGRTAMVLVPEIALTPQLLRIFTAHFGEDVAVLHSSLRAGERYDEWKRVRDGKAKVVIGTRSAVFAPLQNLGLLILDEEQEYSYKSEQVPRYHAREVAKYRCAQSGGLMLLGSATPSVESMYLAKEGVYHLFTMSERYNQGPLPPVHITDMRPELRRGNGGSISGALQDALTETMSRGEQSILFINRRGNSRMVVCGECGEVPTCPRCSVNLTYHSVNNRLMCHYCGHSERMEDLCAHCYGRMAFVGAGTQKVEEELQERFPQTPILRMDTDTITARQSHEKLLARFEKEEIPILVGTQMIAKGLDFENVTLVGVISADQSLYVDDYRAGERTFSLITQVVGRAGRGKKGGTAMIQTHTPENDIIRCAAAQDYDKFYEEEIQLRALRGCPPFRDLFIFTASGLQEGRVLRTCVRLRQTLEGWLSQEPYVATQPQLLGPAPATIAKINERYRYRLTLSCKNTKEMRALVAHLIRCTQSDKETKGVSVFVDVNPLD